MDPLAPLIDNLHSDGRLRVWSLVITACGDLVQCRGGEVSTARLGALLRRVNVEPGALRTALSRLLRDGWVERQRDGRISNYRLSAQGLERFAPATTLIYAAPRAAPVERWAIALRLTEGGGMQPVLCPADHVPAQADCVVSGTLDHVSDAYRAASLTQPHRAALGVLAQDLAAMQNTITEPLDAAAARLLLIHRWRRIVLRYPDIVPDLLPDDAPLRDPRTAVALAYGRVLAGGEAWLDDSSGGLTRMPGADRDLAERFGLSAQA